MKHYPVILALLSVAFVGCHTEKEVEEEVKEKTEHLGQEEVHSGNGMLELNFGPSPGDG